MGTTDIKWGLVKMAAELRDLRTKVTERTAQVLAAINIATGRERSEIARQVLDEWASSQIHASRIVERLTRGEGIGGASEGTGTDSGFGGLGS